MADGAVCVPTPRSEALPPPAQLFVCVHTAPACVWGGDRRPQRSGAARGPIPVEIGTAPW